ncbi:unnamed protein product [Caenorhabditis auriculariae]|uniref:Zinc finger CCCH domain-containing protein 14 n=1 Tax=Caenorhabditis auriculariae TaxID=2777116 RepID=A0A8S1HCP4_9PELO|nr:unnamed protein product [Caenorhabditis auriculariae]
MILQVDKYFLMSTQAGNSEVSKKLKAAIKAKLEELGVYVDDELPDYIMVLIANKKDKAHMKEDLSLFIGKNTAKFVDWLFDLFDRLQNASTKSHDKASSKQEKAEKERRKQEERQKAEKEEKEREREREREKEKARTEQRRHEKEREERREKEREKEREREKQKREEEKERRAQAAHHKKRRSRSRTWSEDEFDDRIRDKKVVREHVPRSPVRKVASTVVVQKPVSKSPDPHKVSSKVVVKRNIRPAGDEKGVKGRGSMFMKALNEASVSAGYGAPSAIRTSSARNQDDDYDSDQDEDLPEEEEQPTVKVTSQKHPVLVEKKKKTPLKNRLTVPADKRIIFDEEEEDADTVVCNNGKNVGPKIFVTLKGAKEQRNGGPRVVVGDPKTSLLGKKRKATTTKAEKAIDSKKSKHDRIRFDLNTTPLVPESADSPTMRKWDGQIQLGEESDTSDEEAEIDAVLASARTVVHDEDDEPLPPTHQLSGGPHPDFAHIIPNTYSPYPPNVPAYVPTPLNVLQHQQLSSGSIAVLPVPVQVHTPTSAVAPYKEESRFVERCRFWPNCTKSDSCQYHHPVKACMNFPSCSFGSRCLYVHPACKFDKNCTKASCPYTHYGTGGIVPQPPSSAPRLPLTSNKPPVHLTLTTTLSSIAAKLAAIPRALESKKIKEELPTVKQEHKEEQENDLKKEPSDSPKISSSEAGVVENVPALSNFTPCRFGASCHNPKCSFKHPKECRFGSNCKNPVCYFYHKPGTTAPVAVSESATKYKWKATTFSACSELRSPSTTSENMLLLLLLPMASGNLLPPIFALPGLPVVLPQGLVYRALPQPVPYNQIGVTSLPPAEVRPPCPMSPLATFLSSEQQETLHELITEARGQGADEQTVKQHINKYLTEILSPQRMEEFQQAEEQFETNRRGKRNSYTENEEKKLPQKVFDLVDTYSRDYQQFYEESSATRQRLSP